MTQSVIIRADGSRGIGHGHVFRTLTLAAELSKHGWNVSYVCRDFVGAPHDRVRAAGYDLRLLGAGISETADAEQTVQAARGACASWIVVDRYATGELAHVLWRRQGFKVLAIDDVCGHPFPVDVLLNQNTDAESLDYSTLDETVRLMGPRYALIRPQYRNARPAHPRNLLDRIARVLVFMGGSDPEDATGKVVEALSLVELDLEVHVVVGSAYPHYDLLLARLEKCYHQMEIHRNLPDLVGVMCEADVAIAAGGSVTWEFCCLGVPMILLTTAANQEGIAASLEELNIAIRLGSAPKVQVTHLAAMLRRVLPDRECLQSYGESGWRIVDGRGAERVALELLGA